MGNAVASSSISMEIPASAKTVWETATDSKEVPRFMSHVVSIERIKEGKYGVGDVWLEVRSAKNGKTVEAYKTVTAASMDPYSISVNVKHKSEKGRESGMNDIIRMGSWVIHPITDSSCEFVWTFAASPKGMLSTIKLILFRKRIERRTTTYFRRDLEDISAEAVRREKKKALNALVGE